MNYRKQSQRRVKSRVRSLLCEQLETRIAPAGFQFEHSLRLNEQMGNGDYVTVSHSGELDLNDTGEFTVEAWIHRINSVGPQTIVSNSIVDSYWVGLFQGRLTLGIDSDISQPGEETIPLGVWTHIAVTWQEGGQRQYFINGNLDYSGPAGDSPGEESGPLTIGNDVSTGLLLMPMDGAISDVRLWSHVRTADEIRRSMHVAIEEPLPGLIANWHFDGRLADDIGRFDGRFVGDANLGGPAPPPQYARPVIDENFNRLTDSAGVAQPRVGAAFVQNSSSHAALMLGGVIGATASRRIDNIDTATGEVETFGSLPRATSDASAAYAPNQDRVLVFGGRNPGSGQIFDSIVQVNPRTGFASDLTTVLPNPLYQSAAVYHPGVDKIYVLGGRSPGLRNTVSVFNSEERSIASGSRNLPRSMADMAAIYSEETGDIYIFGGTDSSGEASDIYRMRVDASDPSGQTYAITQIGFLPVAATGLSVTQDPVSRLIYLVGGHSRFSLKFDHLVAFDPLTEEVWQTLLPVQRSDAGLVYDRVNRHALVIGGSLETTLGLIPQSDILRIPLGDGPAVPLGRWDFPTQLSSSGDRARVTALAGDENRVIVGTAEDGAWRYDSGGGRFHYTPAMLGSASGKVNAVFYHAASDTVLIGTDDSGVLVDEGAGSHQQRLFTRLHVNVLEAIPPGHPFSGSPFIGSDDGLRYVNPAIFPGFGHRLLGEKITAMTHRGPGDLWVVANGQLKNVRYNNQGDVTSIVDYGDQFLGAVPTDLAIAPNGEFWATVAAAEFGAGVYRLLVDGNGNPVGDAQFIEPDAVGVGNLASGIDVDSDGRLWVSVNSGFGVSGGLEAFEIDEDADELRANDPINWLSGPVGEANTDIRSQYWPSNLQDVAGVDERVWTGRFDGNLITYAQRWSQIDESNNLKDKVIRDVWTVRGRLFAAGSDTLYVLNPDGRTWDNRGDIRVQDVLVDSRGAIWVGGEDGPRLYQGSGWDMLTDRAGERPNQRVSAIAEDQHGRIWLGGSDGLTLFDRSRFVATFTPSNSPLPAAAVRSLLVDQNNRLWIGTNLGLAIFENEDRWTVLTQADGLPSNVIREFAQLPDGRVAVSTGGGLVYINSRFSIVRDNTFPLPANSLKLAVDELGRLWADNAVRTPDGWQVYYDTNSGLRSSNISGVAADQADRVWFSHSPDTGLSVRGAYLPPLGNVIPEFDPVTPLVPAAGSNGHTIEIRGAGFGDNLNDIVVTIGGSEVEVREVSNRAIRVRIGPNTTSGDVSVSRAGRRVTIDNAFQAIPVIDEVTPSGGNAGVVVEIRGTNIDPGATVALDGTHFRGPTSNTPTLLTTVILPSDGSGRVTVRNPSGREDTWTTRTFRTIGLTIDRLVLNQGILGYDLVDGKPTFVQHYLAHSLAPRSTDTIQVDRVETTFTGPGGVWTVGPYVQRLFQPDAQRPSHASGPNPAIFETIDDSVNVVFEPHFPEEFVGGNVTVTTELYRNDQLVAPPAVQVTPFQNDRPLHVLLVPIMRRGYSDVELADLRSATDVTLTELRNRVWPLGDVETFWSTTHVFEITDLIDDPLDVDGRIDIGDRIDFFDASHELDEARRWFNDHSNTYADSVYGVVQNDPRVVRDNTADGMAVTPDFELLNDLILTEVDRLCDIAAVGVSILTFGFLGDSDGCSLELPQRVAWGLHNADVGTYAQEIGHNFGLVALGAPNHNDNPANSDFNLAHSDVDELRGGFCGDDDVRFDARLTLYQRQPGVFGPIVNPLSNPELVNGFILPQGQQFVSNFAGGTNGNRAKSVMSYACGKTSENVFFEPVDAEYLQTAFGITHLGGSTAVASGSVSRSAASLTTTGQRFEPEIGLRVRVSGELNRREEIGTITAVRPLSNTASLDLSYYTGFWLVQLDNAGRELRRTGVAPAFITTHVHGDGPPIDPDADDDHGFFAATIVAHPDLARLELRHEDLTLDVFSAGGSPPVVSVNTETVFTPGGPTILVSWSTTDPDGDATDAVLLYSNDDGQSWSPFAFVEGSGAQELPAGRLPGGARARVQVVGSDGFHQVSAVSDSFVVAPKAPFAFIGLPRDNQVLLEGQPVILSGGADDLQDGRLTGDKLSWRSNRDGLLGTGGDLTTFLSVGAHQITLVAENENRLSSDIATISITVVGDYDADGIPDEMEPLFGLSPLASAHRAPDADGDGLSLLAELRHGTDPLVADSDGDGRSDADEIIDGTDPTGVDESLPADTLRVFPDHVDLTVDLAAGTPFPQVLIHIVSQLPTQWTLSSDADWIAFEHTTGNTPATTTIVGQATRLEDGVHQATVMVSGDGLIAPLEIPVTLTVANSAAVFDLDGDGQLTAADLALIAAADGAIIGQPGYDFRLDLDRDGDIDADDYLLAYDKLGHTLTQVVVNTNDSGPGSLRDAIVFANRIPNSDTVTIAFQIPPSSPGFVDVDAHLPGGDPEPDVFVISPLSALPALVRGNIVINGDSQQLLTGDSNPLGPEIVLAGNLAGAGVKGLQLASSNNQIHGLNIQQFSGDGVLIDGSGMPKPLNPNIDYGTVPGVPSEMPPTASTLTGVVDKNAFLAATGAQPVAPFENLGSVGTSYTTTDGKLTITGIGGSLWVGAVPEDHVENDDWTLRLEGADIAVFAVEDLDIDLAAPAYSFGFEFVEPENDPNIFADFEDSTFRVTLKLGTEVITSFDFNAPNDQAVFIGAQSEQPFDHVEIRETFGAAENEFFGRMYIGNRSGRANSNMLTGNYIGTNAVGTSHLQPVATYLFDGQFNGSGSEPSLVPIGPGQFLVDSAVLGAAQTVYAFESGSGFSLDATSVVPRDNYTFEFLFQFDDVVSWQKIVDYENLTLDTGFYVYDGQLQFWPEEPGGEFNAATYHHIVLTRSSTTGIVAGYLDGRQAFQFLDSGNIADIDNADDLLTFFIDDTVTNSNEISAGRIALLRIYDEPLSAAEVLTLNPNSALLGNGGNGVHIVNSSGNVIGGAAGSDRNVVSGNRGEGVKVAGEFSDGNVIQNNYIGLNAAGTAAVGNFLSGVFVPGATSTHIVDNVVSGNRGFAGIAICGSDVCGGAVSSGDTSGTVIQGNFVGTSANGDAAVGNLGFGISIDGGMGRTIGGLAESARNIISGNGLHGVYFFNGATGDVVQGNYIGTTADGMSALGNAAVGVYIDNSSNNLIGGMEPGVRNVISANDTGIAIIGSLASGNHVAGNFVGLGADGMTGLGNVTDGVHVAVLFAEGSGLPENVIGGATADERNVISGSGQNNIILGSSGTIVQGNYIGTDQTGTQLPIGVGRGRVGIRVTDDHDSVIGGTEPGAGNVIAGHSWGIYLSGRYIPGGAQGTKIQGNRIGTTANGESKLANIWGVYADGFVDSNGVTREVTNVLIGGTDPGAGNLISGHQNEAIVVFGPGSQGIRIQGNSLGTDITGTSALGNGGGVRIDSATGVLVGGTDENARNVISGNTGNGISIIRGGDHIISGNYIGTTADGLSALGNAAVGVYIDNSSNNLIGGSDPDARNVISANNIGVEIAGPLASDNHVTGNYIGLGKDGVTDLGNFEGVLILGTFTDQRGAAGNVIGGPTEADRNVITFNVQSNVRFSRTLGNTLQRNYIGTDWTGTQTAVPNQTHAGVRLWDDQNSLILDNVISGTTNGVQLVGENLIGGTSGTRIQGNLIGTTADGQAALWNRYGIYVDGLDNDDGYHSEVSNILIGGTGEGEGNVVSGNGINVETGIVVRGSEAQGIVIQGNKIGTDVDGDKAFPNVTGILVDGTLGVVVGGIESAARNVISGNTGNGISITGGGGHVVQGNLIGTTSDGLSPLGNGDSGVRITGSTGNLIGGDTEAARNVISGNAQGVGITGAASSDNVISGNYVGVDRTGSGRLRNLVDGIAITTDASGNRVGGWTEGERNVISGNGRFGILIAGTLGNQIQGNFIGTDATGTSSVPNTPAGIVVFNDVGTLIGGSEAGAGNVISGNTGDGIILYGGLGAKDVHIEGNRIGTTADGRDRLFNSGDGIRLLGTGGNEVFGTVIGGTDPGAGNVISGNSRAGIRVSGDQTLNVQILGNLIGTDVEGQSAVWNGEDGVVIQAGAGGVIVGGTDEGARNVISGNRGNGIAIDGSAPELKTEDFYSSSALIAGWVGVGNHSNRDNFDSNIALPWLPGDAFKAGGAFARASSTLGETSDPVSYYADTHLGGTLTLQDAIQAEGELIVTALNSFDGSVEIGYLNQLSAAANLYRNLLSLRVAEPSPQQGTDGIRVLAEIVLANGTRVFGTAINSPDGLSANTNYTWSYDYDPNGGVFGAGELIVELFADGISLGTSRAVLTAAHRSIGASFDAFGLHNGGQTVKSANPNTITMYIDNVTYTRVTRNSIQGNYIGTTANGLAALGNVGDGIRIVDSSNNLIGGSEPGARNVISANGTGVSIVGSLASGNHVAGNYIGLAADGITDLGNTLRGVFVGGHQINLLAGADNVIGGVSPAERNVISGNGNNGPGIGNIFLKSLGTVVQGNYIGTDWSGSYQVAADIRDGVGIWLEDDKNSVIGGTQPGAGNLIAGNEIGIVIDGRWVVGGTENTQIQGNRIGTNRDGDSPLNNRYGIYITGHVDSDGVTHPINNVDIGGTDDGAENLVSGNWNVGIIAFGPGVQDLRVQGNKIGIDINGEAAVPNGAGILLQDTAGVLIGGNSKAARNMISGNTGYGVALLNGSHNMIEGNFIGTDVSGTLDRGNGLSGVLIQDSTGNTVSENVISGNDNNGVLLIGSTPTTDITNLIEANFIGTDVTGMRDLGNLLMGVRVDQGMGPVIRGNVISGNDNSNVMVDVTASQVLIEDNLIGTDMTGNAGLLAPVGFGTVGVTLVGHHNTLRGNVISANPIDGVNIDGLDVPDGRGGNNVLQDNLIGVGLDGMKPLGNGRYGIRLWRGASNNLIGTTGNDPAVDTEGNVIAFNPQQGVLVIDEASTGNTIRGNSIYSNGGLGIDLGGDGVTPNDNGDLAAGIPPDDDSGPNNLQNFPRLNSVRSGAETLVTGIVRGKPGDSFVVDFYAGAEADPTRYGEGQRWIGTTLGSTPVVANVDGVASFNVTLPATTYGGEWVTATATQLVDADGDPATPPVLTDTSEFAESLQIKAGRGERGPNTYVLQIELPDDQQPAGYSTVSFDVQLVGVAGADLSGSQIGVKTFAAAIQRGNLGGPIGLPFEMAAYSSAASPRLLQAAVQGLALGHVELVGHSTIDDAPYDFARWSFDGAAIGSFATNDSEQDQFTLSYDRLQYDYRPLTETGAPGAMVSGVWDVAASGGIVADAFPSLAPLPPTAESHYYLHIPGVEGDSLAENYPGWIEVESFDFAMLGPGLQSSHPVQATTIGVVARAGRATPKLLAAAGSGEVFAAPVEIAVVRRLMDQWQDLAHWSLDGAGISSYATASGVLDQFSISFDALHYSFANFQPNGTPLPPVAVSWDLEQTGAVLTSGEVDPPDASPELQSTGILVHMPGVTGDSTTPGYVGWITVEEFQYQMQRSLSAGRASGPPQATTFGFVTPSGSASPRLFELTATGAKFDSAVEIVLLHQVKTGLAEFARWTLDGASLGDFATVSALLDSFTLTFDAVHSQAFPIDPIGGPLPAVEGDWSPADTGSQVFNDPPQLPDNLSPKDGIELLLEIPGIQGPSTKADYPGWIPVQSYAFQLSRPAAAGSAELVAAPFQFAARTSKASPELLRALSTGQSFAGAKLVAVTTGSKAEEFARWSLSNVQIAGYATEDSLADTFTLSFDSLTYALTPPSPTKKTKLPPITAAADLSTAQFITGEPHQPAAPQRDDVSVLAYIPGFHGSSKLDNYAGWIEIDSARLAAVRPRGDSGAAQVSAFQLLSRGSLASTEILQAVADGRVFSGADAVQVVTLQRRSNGVFLELTRWDLQDASITTYATESAWWDGFSIAFDELELTYTPISPKGFPETSVVVPWSLAATNAQLVDHGPPAPESALPDGVELLLHLPGIDGESKRDGFSGWMELESLAFALSRTADGSGSASASSLWIDLKTTAASPQLLDALADGGVFPTVDIVVFSDQGYEYADLTLAGVTVTAFESTDLLRDRLGLTFSAIQFTRREPAGTLAHFDTTTGIWPAAVSVSAGLPPLVAAGDAPIEQQGETLASAAVYVAAGYFDVNSSTAPGINLPVTNLDRFASVTHSEERELALAAVMLELAGKQDSHLTPKAAALPPSRLGDGDLALLDEASESDWLLAAEAALDELLGRSKK